MHCQVLTHKINIFFQIFPYLFNLYRLLRAGGYAFGKLTRYVYTVIAPGIEIRDKILKDYPEGASKRTGLAARAAHLIAFYMAVGSALERIMVTGIDAGRLFAMTADCGECRVFT
jgi:hypothetical protein